MGPNINYKDFSDTTGRAHDSNSSALDSSTANVPEETIAGPSSVNTVEDTTATVNTVEDTTSTVNTVEDTTATVGIVEDPTAAVEIVRSSMPTGDIFVISSSVMRNEADYAYF
ncbi:hypothetical protein GCM10027600_06520 [Nocardioides ginsengisegetis]